MSAQDAAGAAPNNGRMSPQLYPVALIAWLWVLAPFGWGLYKLLEKVNNLFG